MKYKTIVILENQNHVIFDCTRNLTKLVYFRIIKNFILLPDNKCTCSKYMTNKNQLNFIFLEIITNPKLMITAFFSNRKIVIFF